MVSARKIILDMKQMRILVVLEKERKIHCYDLSSK